MKDKTLTPEDLARKGLTSLQKMADPARSRQAQRYFKEEARFYGISSADARTLARNLYEEVKKDWTPDEALRLCEILLPHPYHDARALGILILSRYKKSLAEEFFERIHGWLSRNYLDNWALVDITCPDLVGALLEKYPSLVDRIKAWAFSDNRWVRRASLVSFIKLAKKIEFRDAVYQISASLFSDRDDLIQKANGWLLREAGKGDVKRLERFLLDNGPVVPRTTLRYAIERFEEKKRKGILEKTRLR